MAKPTFEEVKNNPEFNALMDIEGIDAASIVEQAGGEAAPVVPPVEDGIIPPVVPPVEDGITPPVIPPVVPPVADPVPGQQGVLLKEIFGDRFQTVEEAKNANIVGLMDEVVSLREAKTDLETKLGSKPKTNFANDEVALYNEFVRETGTRDYGVFNKINSTEVATMDPMEALITKYVLDNPSAIGKEPQIRKHFEKKYNVDPDQVDEEDLEVNKISMESDGASAKKALQEVKDKLTLPEPTMEPDTPKELTPEEKSTLKSGWNNVGQKVSTALSKLQIPIKNGKEPLLEYEVSEAEQGEITEFVQNYAVENRMELNETNVKTISTMVYNQLMISKLPEIAHSIFEKARSLTEEQVHSMYNNPSPDRNNDSPPVPPTPAMTPAEEQEEKIFQAEMDNYNK